MGMRDICTVLCIDDQPRTLKLRQRVLEKHGYSVVAADSGPLGLALLSTCRVDAVVVDYRVQLMDGVEVAQKIRRQYGGRIPILLATTYRGELPSKLREFFDACVTERHSAEALVVELRRLQGERPRKANSPTEPIPVTAVK